MTGKPDLPTCPICHDKMVPSRIECHDGRGWTLGWICSCTDELRDKALGTITMMSIDASTHAGARVYLDGNDVSAECVQAFVPAQQGCEAPGWVRLVARHKNGDPVVRNNDIVTETRAGQVRWEEE